MKAFFRQAFLVAFVMVLVLLMLGAAWFFFNANTPSTAAASNLPVFDHMQCQYPTRSTNPANSCDNSDPACPAEIKGGSCEPNKVSAPITSPIVAPAAPKVPKTPSCEAS